MLVARRGSSARTTEFVRPVLQTRVIDVCVLLGSGESTARKVCDENGQFLTNFE